MKAEKVKDEDGDTKSKGNGACFQEHCVSSSGFLRLSKKEVAGNIWRKLLEIYRFRYSDITGTFSLFLKFYRSDLAGRSLYLCDRSA